MVKKLDNIYDKVSSFIKPRIPLILVFVIIFILLYGHHSLLHLYFDDFGNGSVSYGRPSPDIIGTNFTIPQLLDWAGFIYNEWGGRILYAIVFLIPMIKHGAALYMFAQSLVITGIFYYIYKIIKDNTKYDSIFIPVVLLIMYLLFDMAILRHGIYWASASILYIWPLLPTFMFIYYFMELSKKISRKEKVKYILWIPILCILSFFAIFSHEQIGTGIIIFLGFYIAIQQGKKIKNYLKLDIPVGIVSILSYALLIIAPGNWARMDSNTEFASLDFFGKIMQNFPRIMVSIFEYKYFIVVLAALIFFAIYINIDKFKGNKRRLGLIIILFLIPTAVYIGLTSKILYCAYGLLWFIVLGLAMIYYFNKTKRPSLIALPIGGTCCYFCLLVSPTVGGRTLLPFWFFIFILIGLFFAEIIKEKKPVCNIILIIAFSILAFIGIKNYHTIYKGYANNYAIEMLNFKILDNYDEAKNGDKITLYKYDSVWYGSTRLYEEPSMKTWLFEYFNIPNKVQVEWVDPYEDIRVYD